MYGSRDRDDESGFDESKERDEDEAFPDGEVQTEAEVTCPYCGETVTIELDSSGGTSQEYVEDCEVCCQPWKVRVQYDDSGSAEVTVEESS
ncbi:MAG TPA: CPXCG motif-containing cysteine-rich protein [Gemmatimonadales bacterium]|nr:CPXCG motif-containing cysteine-rich protein [Gemmatimonadales bacterium]